jgi:hypothetical protein
MCGGAFSILATQTEQKTSFVSESVFNQVKRSCTLLVALGDPTPGIGGQELIALKTGLRFERILGGRLMRAHSSSMRASRSFFLVLGIRTESKR